MGNSNTSRRLPGGVSYALQNSIGVFTTLTFNRLRAKSRPRQGTTHTYNRLRAKSCPRKGTAF